MKIKTTHSSFVTHCCPLCCGLHFTVSRKDHRVGTSLGDGILWSINHGLLLNSLTGWQMTQTIDEAEPDDSVDLSHLNSAVIDAGSGGRCSLDIDPLTIMFCREMFLGYRHTNNNVISVDFHPGKNLRSASPWYSGSSLEWT